jgi:hypothetical protein
MNNTDTTFAAVSAWIATSEAKALKAKLIKEGTVSKEQIKLSSYRWADIKDHDKGYICRVMVVKGLLPDMEVADAKPRKQNKNAIGAFAEELPTANSCNEAQNINVFWRRNLVNDTLTA